LLTRRQIIGNLAYKDNIEKKRKKEKQVEDLIKKRAIILKSIQADIKKDIMQKIMFIAIGCVISFFVVFRSAKLIDIQKDLNDVNNSIGFYEKQNENISVQILMERDLNKIDQVATEKLDMISAEKSEIKTLNGVNDYFDEQPAKSEGLLDKIKSFFQDF